MMRRCFYYPDGSKINGEKDFIDFYSKAYYLFVTNEQEEMIDCLLNKQEAYNDADILKFMNWKFGGKSLTWEKIKLKKLSYRRTEIGEEFLEKVKAVQNKYSINDGNLDEVYNLLVDVGPVYAIAVIYLLTKGTYSIFDRRVRCAMGAICSKDDIVPGQKVHIRTLTKENALSEYKAYIEFYKEFEETKDDKRIVDRALWTYGHLFQD